MSRILLLQGNQAVVEGAIAAGVKFYGGVFLAPFTWSLAELVVLVALVWTAVFYA